MNKLKHLLRITFICLLILLWSCPSYALTIEDISNPRQTYGGWVTDQASILSDTTESQLNQEISQLKSSKGIELAVVTVTDTSPAPSTKSFASELFNDWGIGNKRENNGILFLVSVKEHRVEIETGSGIEKVLSNSKISQIIEEEIKPRFREEKFDLGVIATTARLIAEFQDLDLIKPNPYLRYIKAFLILGLISLLGFAFIHRATRRKKYYSSSSQSDDYGGYGSSDSGEGSDFGGGDSDGGGAGGDW
jgi:uncharacterized protein